MRKLIASEFMTIDGVIQNEENDGDGFTYGGWFFPYADEVTGAALQVRLAKPIDLLLGRKTFDGWETYWPTIRAFWPNVMTVGEVLNKSFEFAYSGEGGLCFSSRKRQYHQMA